MKDCCRLAHAIATLVWTFCPKSLFDGAHGRPFYTIWSTLQFLDFLDFLDFYLECPKPGRLDSFLACAFVSGFTLLNGCCVQCYQAHFGCPNHMLLNLDVSMHATALFQQVITGATRYDMVPRRLPKRETLAVQRILA